MKKVISALLSVSMLLGTAAISANAATADESTVGAHNYSVVDTTTLKNGQVRLYTYNFTDNNPDTIIRMTDTTLNISKNFYFNDVDGCKQINLSSSSVIEHYFLIDGCLSGVVEKRYDNTGGTYEKIRIKLSDYDDYFNSDGTHTENVFDYNSDGTQTENGFDYNFSTQYEGIYTYKSALLFFSGGIFTAVTPSNDGYAEFYVSKNIGEETRFSTRFSRMTSDAYAGDSELTNWYFNYFTMGNANADVTGVNVDDVTAIQSYSAGIEDFDNLQKRNADVNFDGKIDVNDATMVQKHLADLI